MIITFLLMITREGEETFTKITYYFIWKYKKIS